MNIPDEVLHDAYKVILRRSGEVDAYYQDGIEAAFQVIAEWARKEALREAAEAAQDYIYEWRRADNGDTFVEGIAVHTADTIRALVGGDKTDD